MTAVLPLLALRAFTEVGRCGSVKAAAQSMGVSPGAVSQQIRILEDRVGFSLFVRSPRGIKLTQRAEQVHETLLVSFDNIDKSLRSLKAMRRERRVAISTTPTFAASWLIPRLLTFYQRFPHIELSVEASNQLVDLKHGNIDIALRHGLGCYAGLNSLRLVAPRLIPVASPALLASGPKIEHVRDCLCFPLLQEADRLDWHLWLQAQGIDDEARARRGPSYEDDFLLARAAVTGQGIALVPEFCVEEELRDGKLLKALDHPWPARFAYYAVTLPEAQQRDEIQAVLQWLVQQCCQQPDT